MKNTRNKYTAIGMIAIGLLGYMYVYKRLAILDTLASYLAYPILRVNSLFIEPIRGLRDERKTVQQLRALLAQLRQEKEDLQQNVIALQSQLQYVQDTDALHEFAQQYDTLHMCVAQIITKIFSDQQHYFLVDAGRNKGIETDMVALYKNCLLGRVIEVYPWYSKIILVTDRSCKVAAVCSQTQAQGIHEGLNTVQETQLSFVSHLEPLSLSDMVISSGEGLVFPRGFGLGKIKEFYANELHYTINIEPLIDFSKITYCYLMKKGSIS